MFAIVDIAGFQEKVTKGDTLSIPLHAAKEGAAVRFDNVLLISDGDKVTVGMPHVSGAFIEAKILSHGRGDKIRVSKFHRRKRYRRVHGHRQDYTEIEVTGISV